MTLKEVAQRKKQKHEASGIRFFLKCLDKTKDKVVLYTKQSKDDSVASIFVEMLQKEVERIWDSTKTEERNLNEEDKVKFKKEQNLGFVKRILKTVTKKFRDHCHFTWKFRGPTHNKCNLLYWKPVCCSDISKPCWLGRASCEKNLGGQIDCIPNNEEKCTSFAKSIYDGKNKFR